MQAETKSYFDSLVSGNFDVALWPATEPADDPTSMLYYFISHDASTMSYSRHADKKLDELHERQNRTLDVAERERLVREARRYILTQATKCRCCGGTHHPSRTTRRSRLDHVAEPFQGTDLAEVWLDE